MSTAASVRPVRQLPEPSRCWIAFAPRRWRSAGGPWTDLARSELAGWKAAPEEVLPSIDAEDLGDLLFLPPVRPQLAPERDQLAAGLAEAGTPVLLALRPGEEVEIPGVSVVYDLLPPLLAGDLASLSLVPSGASAVWPLVPGLSDSPEAWDEGCRRLAESGVVRAQPLAVDLAPGARRWLAEERGDEAFDALFHGSAPSEREFARRAAGFGLEVFLPRPPTGRTRRETRNRRAAAELALAGELWLRLGRSESAGQAFLRGARGADVSPHDLAALTQEGNLGVLGWLDARGVEMVRQVMAGEASSLVAELMAEYLGE